MSQPFWKTSLLLKSQYESDINQLFQNPSVLKWSIRKMHYFEKQNYYESVIMKDVIMTLLHFNFLS